MFALAFVIVATTFVWHKFHHPFIFVLPLVLLAGVVAVYNYRLLFYAMFSLLPASLHIELGSNAVDSSEPLMLFFTGIGFLHLISAKGIDVRKNVHPYFVFLFLILAWTLLTSMQSELPLRSYKYLLSKIWYIVPFVFVAYRLIEKPLHFQKVFWCFNVPLVLFSLFTTYKHGIGYGFSFEGGYAAPYPQFINHVIYGCVVVQFIPFVWNALAWYPPGSFAHRFLQFSLGVLLVGAALSYGRLAWLCVLALPFVYLTIQHKLFDKLIYAGLIGIFALVFYTVSGNNYYKFAPDFNKTIFHEGDLEAHLSATFQGTDASGMERFYRWIAAKNMVAAQPFWGFGPSTFSQVYQQYADDAFTTWVSENEDQSTTHNYFLMTCSEQGFIGLFLFAGVLFYMLIQGYKFYHRTHNALYKNILLSILLCLTVITLHSFLNELIEVDKIGAMLWFSMLMIVKVGDWIQEDEAKILA